VYFLALEKKIDRKKEEILFLFLDIPRREVSDIFKKCVNFLNFCNVMIFLLGNGANELDF
jgi:hypothetical protein